MLSFLDKQLTTGQKKILTDLKDEFEFVKDDAEWEDVRKMAAFSWTDKDPHSGRVIGSVL